MGIERLNENAPGALADPALAETLSYEQLGHALVAAGKTMVSIDDRNWHAPDRLENLAAAGMVKTRSGEIVEYRLGHDGTYAIVNHTNPKTIEDELKLEQALLAAKSRGEAGPKCLEWALELPTPEAQPVGNRIRHMTASVRARLNIGNAEKPDHSVAA